MAIRIHHTPAAALGNLAMQTGIGQRQFRQRVLDEQEDKEDEAKKHRAVSTGVSIAALAVGTALTLGAGAALAPAALSSMTAGSATSVAAGGLVAGGAAIGSNAMAPTGGGASPPPSSVAAPQGQGTQPQQAGPPQPAGGAAQPTAAAELPFELGYDTREFSSASAPPSSQAEQPQPPKPDPSAGPEGPPRSAMGDTPHTDVLHHQQMEQAQNAPVPEYMENRYERPSKGLGGALGMTAGSALTWANALTSAANAYSRSGRVDDIGPAILAGAHGWTQGYANEVAMGVKADQAVQMWRHKEVTKVGNRMREYSETQAHLSDKRIQAANERNDEFVKLMKNWSESNLPQAVIDKGVKQIEHNMRMGLKLNHKMGDLSKLEEDASGLPNAEPGPGANAINETADTQVGKLITTRNQLEEAINNGETRTVTQLAPKLQSQQRLHAGAEMDREVANTPPADREALNNKRVQTGVTLFIDKHPQLVMKNGKMKSPAEIKKMFDPRQWKTKEDVKKASRYRQMAKELYRDWYGQERLGHADLSTLISESEKPDLDTNPSDEKRRRMSRVLNPKKPKSDPSKYLSPDNPRVKRLQPKQRGARHPRSNQNILPSFMGVNPTLNELAQAYQTK